MAAGYATLNVSRTLEATTRYLHPMIIVLPYNWCADESGIVPTIVEGQGPDTLEFRGTVSFTNPYGSIPARLSTLLPFHYISGVAYMALLLMFGCGVLYYRKEVHRVQLHILAVLLVAVLECASWVLLLRAANVSGTPLTSPSVYLAAALLLTCARQTGMRLVLLLVCLGYGVARRFLPRRVWCSVLCFFSTYFVLSVVDTYTYIGTAGSDDGGAMVFVLLLVPVSNIVLLYWIWIALLTTSKEMEDQRQREKLSMYQSLGRLLSWTVIAFTMSTVFALLSDPRSGVCTFGIEWFHRWWLLHLYPGLSLLVAVGVAYIWQPSPTTLQYAISMQLPASEEDADIDVVVGKDGGDGGFEISSGDDSDGDVQPTVV